MTEDVPDGGFYRFRPTHGLPDLREGQLEIASVIEKDGKNLVEWQLVPDPLAQTAATRRQVVGYEKFAGGEGIAIHEDKVYFSTKHDNRVWQYNTNSHQLEVIYDVASSHNPILKGVDNITITPAGDVMVAEDNDDMQLVVLTPDDRVIPFLQIVGHETSEITGPAFDPNFERLYFSSQRGSLGKSSGGITYEISRIES